MGDIDEASVRTGLQELPDGYAEANDIDPESSIDELMDADAYAEMVAEP